MNTPKKRVERILVEYKRNAKASRHLSGATRRSHHEHSIRKTED